MNFNELKDKAMCAMCKNKNCHARFSPGRKVSRFDRGKIIVEECEKEKKNESSK